MMALLLEPLQFTFMSHALLISLVVSIPCALLSVFLVLKGWALMGDAMSHAVFSRYRACVDTGVFLWREEHLSPEYSARWRRDT